MTDNYQWSGGGATSVLPPVSPPEWIAEPPPWSQSWLPPTVPASAGGGGGFAGPNGPYAGWQPPVPEAPKKPGRAAMAVVIVAALLAGATGVFIGSRLGRTGSTTTPLAASTPATVPTPSSGGNTSPFGGSTSSGGSSSGATPVQPSTGTFSGNAAAIAAKVIPGIVDINTRLGYANEAAAGTGQVITPNGIVLTNNHVIEGSTSISVTIPSTGRTYTATVVGDDPTEDVAVLQLKGASGLKTIPVGDSSSVSTGDSVVALGNAGGVGGAPSVVTGTVLGLDQTISASDESGAAAETLNGMIETNAPIQPGDSGGPLVNTNGQVIGMDTAASSARRFNAGGTVSFAIPIDHALSIAQEIEAGKASSTVQIGLPGFLGVALSTTSTGSASVTSVVSGAPAAKAGVAAGDAITSLNGTAVTSAQGLTAAMAGHHSGDKVTMTWTTQSGSSKSATLTLTAGPAN